MGAIQLSPKLSTTCSKDGGQLCTRVERVWKGSGGYDGRTPMSGRHRHFARATKVPLLRGRFVVGEQCRNREVERRRDLVDADCFDMAAPSFIGKANRNRVVLGE